MMKNEFYKYLCCGYDKIRNSYANQKRMTFTPILDETLLEQRTAAWYTAPEGTSRSESHTAISTSRYEMEESFDTSCGVSYNVLNVSAEHKKMAEYFAGHSEIKLWTIGGTPAALSDWEERKDVMKTWMESLEEAPAMY